MEPETIIKQALGDKYDIQFVIGKGGMATVYKAIQRNLNRPVALKVIHQNLVHDEEFIQRFLREAQVCASLSYHNIVTVYDIGSIGSVHFMSMEYLEGMTLRDLVKKRGSLSTEETSKYIIPVAETLHFIHNQRIIHRDVKSSNIFITKDGRVVLMDFGIVFSENRDPLSYSGTILGTPEYMSPEQIEGKLKIDRRSDIYSLGVIMFECLTGRLPFTSDNYLTTLTKVVNDHLPSVTSFNPGVPKWISSIVANCLEKDRSKRMADGLSLSNALKKKETIKISKQPVNIDQKKLLLPIIIVLAIIILILGLMIYTPLTIIKTSERGSGSQSVTNTVTPPNNRIASQPVTQSNNIRLVDPESERKTNIGRFITYGDQQIGIQSFETAINYYKEALLLDPSNSIIQQKISDTKSKWLQSIISQGDNYLLNQNYDLALSTYTKAKQLDPSNNTVANKIRNAETEKKNYEIQQDKLIQKRKKEEALRNLDIEMILIENSATGNFYMGKSEVTQSLWKAIMGSNPSSMQGDNMPVETISWTDVQLFLQKLHLRTNMNFRLPTSREWEFAAQGGQSSFTYSGSIKISDVGWYEANSGSKTHPVMQLSPNNYGLYDMTGNVWEFCSDHSLKGGSWLSPSSKCNILNSGNPNDQGDYTIGFRICRSAE